MKIVVGTRNPGKVREIERELAGLDVELIPLSSFPDIPELSETGSSFSENAGHKAMEVAKATGLTAVADDSGLEVEALGGKPGIFSARFVAEDATDEANNQKLLDAMEGVPEDERTARFRCVIALAEPGGTLEIVEGECEGLILKAPRGEQGFGYDPLFFYPPLGLTFAEMDMETKLLVSHRGKALRNLKELLQNRITP
jgi:XTP/dITP diphosphohydrolase